VIEMTEFTVGQGIDIPLTSQDTATVTAVATTRNGRGTGSLTTSFRRVLADLSWFRVCSFYYLFIFFSNDNNLRLI
jgi:hypothetical protein